MTTQPLVERSEVGAVLVLTLARPRAKNALSAELMEELRIALQRAAQEESVRAVVITGQDGNFCAGADISAFENFRTAPLVGDRSSCGQLFWDELSNFPKPVVAAVEGYALGGGCELALACDIVVAAESATFGLPEVKLGVIPGAGGTQNLIRSVGKAAAMQMLLTGAAISADEARRMGLASTVCAEGKALEAALAIGHAISGNSPTAVALAKNAALAALDTGLAQGLEHEKRNFHVAILSPDSYEGQQAFLEKRRPAFSQTGASS